MAKKANSSSNNSSHSSYSEARRAFDDLKVEEKARFMLEAVFSTVADGIDRVSEVISDSMDDAMRGCESEEAEGESKKATPKAATSRKKSTKKTGSRKKSAAKRKGSDTSRE